MKTTILRLLLIYIGLFNNGTAFLRDVQLNRCVTLRDFAFEYSTFLRVKPSLFGIQKTSAFARRNKLILEKSHKT